MEQAEKYLQNALNAFDFGGEVVGAVRYGKGHINDTFCVHTQQARIPAAALFFSGSAPELSIIRNSSWQTSWA